MLATRLTILMADLDERAKKFAEGLQGIRLELAADTTTSLSSFIVDTGELSPLERILGAAGGLALGNVGGAIYGGVLGFREVLKGFAPQLAVYIASALLLGWNPLFLIAAIVGSSLLQGVLKLGGVTKKIRDVVGKEYTDMFRAARPDLANKVTKAVDEKLSDLQDALDQGLGLEIQNIRDQVNSVIAEKQRGQTRVDAAIRRLEAIPAELDMLDSEIDALVERVSLAK